MLILLWTSLTDLMGNHSVWPVVKELGEIGAIVWSERILVGEGFAGRCDLCLDLREEGGYAIVDFKTTKKLPKNSYPEHKMQLAAYGKASGLNVTKTANIYISTSNPGEIAVIENTDIDETYAAFQHLVKVWQWVNNYVP